MLSLRQRLVLVNLVVFLVTLVVLVTVMANQILSHFYEQLDRELAQSAAYAAGRLSMAEGQLRLGVEDLRPTGDPDAWGFVRLLDDQGRLVGGAGRYDTAPVRGSVSNVSEHGAGATRRSDSGIWLRVYTLPVYMNLGEDGTDPNRFEQGYIQVAAEPEEVLEVIAQIRRSLLIGIPLALFFAGLGGLWAARKALQPLEQMTRSAADISADSLAERRLPIPHTHDELQDLALAFNATLARLSGAFVRQRRFTADASHELRTPVAAILGQAELALSRPRTPDAYQETLRRIQDEAQRMQRLIGRLLALARAESGQQVLSFAPIDVTALLTTLTDSLASGIETDGVRVELQAAPSITMITDADSLTQIVLNMLENALTYAGHGVIQVSLAVQADCVVIQIRDDGPGFAPEDLASIFEPFYRADPSRRREHGSVGLGLALAQELAHLLGGQIEAANRLEGGAVFTVSLPLRPPTGLDLAMRSIDTEHRQA